MVENDVLISEFAFMGLENLDEEIIIKCIEIGDHYKMDAERIVEEWIAFSQTNLGGNIKPTLATLERMETKQLSKYQEQVGDKETKDPSVLEVYSGKSTNLKNILNAYNNRTPKKNLHTTFDDNLDSSIFSPVSLNPQVTKPSVAYAARTDRETVVSSFGATSLIEQESKKYPRHNVVVKVLEQESWNSSHSRYMFDAIDSEASALNDRIDLMGYHLKNNFDMIKKSDNNSQTSSNENKQNGSEDAVKDDIEENKVEEQETVEEDLPYTYGQIRSDGDRLNNYSVLLETSVKHGHGQVSVVNLNSIPKFALFPGQIVMMNAKLQNNINKKSILFASALHTNARPDLPKELPQISESCGPIKIIVACGPYTLTDNLIYQPLQDLVKYALNQRPDVLILIGPFVDQQHNLITDGTLMETYLSHFEKLMEQVLTPLQDTDIQVVIVSSSRDAHHHSVYPTPPFEPLPNHQTFRDNVYMVPDPCILDINGVNVGMTSADVLFHLAKTELHCQLANSDRMARFAEHVLSQRCFYPIYPPQASALGEKRLSVDLQSLNLRGEMHAMPHLLILPSILRHFSKNVNGCVVVNPERLSKGLVGGTFAEINIHPGQTSESIENSTTCKIIKI